MRRFAATVMFWLAFVACGAGEPGRVDVFSADFAGPGVVELGVASCNGEPEAEVVDRGEGRYEVRVRTTRQWDVGNDCNDVVTFSVDKAFDQFLITDLTSGEEFPVPSREIAPPTVDIDGRWEMVEVNGEPVVVGVNTQVTPLIDISAGFLSGDFGCNSGGGELLQEQDVLRVGVLETEQELCGISDGSDTMVLTERTVVAMLESADGVAVSLDGDRMVWTRGSNRVVFVLR